MSDTTPQVSVIIVSHNSLPELGRCLETLAAALTPMAFELILVDNDSADAGVAETTTRFPDCRVIGNAANLGFAAACNRGAQAARGEYLAFVNPDVRLDSGAVATLVDTAERDEQAGLVSGRLRNPDGSFQATCRHWPTPGNMVFSRGSIFFGWLGSGRSGGRYTLPDSDTSVEVPAVAATLVVIRRERFDEVGGFDERFFMYMEDTDLSLRLNLAGYHNQFVPAAGGVHRWAHGSDTGRLRRLWYHHRSIWKYFLKHYPNGFSVLVLPLLLTINYCLKALLAGRTGETPQ